MLKFYRLKQLKKKLLQKGQFRKYLVYATGEILLIVVGILLALQINNWSESRKSRQKTTELFSRVQKELALNIHNSDQTIQLYRKDHPFIYKVIQKSVTREDYFADPYFAYVIYSTFTTNTDNQAFNNLINFESEFSKDQDSLIAQLEKLYKVDKKLVDILNDQILTNFFEYHDKLKNTKNWFGDYALFQGITDEMVDYFLNDPMYFNEAVSHLRTNYEEHLGATIDFRNKALEIYAELSNYLKLPIDPLILPNAAQFDHYVGLYRLQANPSVSLRIERKTDYFVCKITEKNDDRNAVQLLEVYPNTKSTCTIGDGFGAFIFDNQQEISALIYSTWNQQQEFTKVE